MSKPTINGPEDITPGHFYHHAGLPGLLYFAVCEYWDNPGIKTLEPMPGTEAMVIVNGDLPGAIVHPPDERAGVDFWRAFYPTPGPIATGANYGEPCPAEIQAKDHAITKYGNHMTTLILGLEWIADRAEHAAKESGTYDPGKEEFLRLAQAARNLVHRSPFHK